MSFRPDFFNWKQVREAAILDGFASLKDDKLWNLVLARHIAMRRMDIKPHSQVGLPRCDCIKVCKKLVLRNEMER